MDNWSRCPRCDSNRVEKVSKWVFILTFFGGAGCLVWVGLLFPLLWIVVPILLIMSFIMLFSRDMWQCQDCKHSWAVKKTKQDIPIVQNSDSMVLQQAPDIPNPQPETPKPTKEEVIAYVSSLKGFPGIDNKGMNILKILDNVRLTGVTKEYDGVNPQDTIESLGEGDEVFFKRVPMKNYPNATLVIDCSGDPIGWIPESFSYQEDIAKRIDDGTTVKGRVSSIYGGEYGKSYGITIDIARYEKKRRKN